MAEHNLPGNIGPVSSPHVMDVRDLGSKEEFADDSPAQTSGDYCSMAPYWSMVSAIIDGAEAMRRQAMPGSFVAGPQMPYSTLSQLRGHTSIAESPYLPKFPNESSDNYLIRLAHAPLVNIYSEASDNLTSKPFSKTCQLDDTAADDLKKLSEDIDGQGNNLHVFAKNVFKRGVDKAIDWILIDFTKVPAGATLAEERMLGARPYWVHIPAERLLAIYSVFVSGKEVLTHARIYEPIMKREGFKECLVKRVRIFNREPIVNDLGVVVGFFPTTWQVMEEKEEGTGTNKKVSWVVVEGGLVSIDRIALVPFMTGEREGMSWRVKPPLRDLAYLQVEEFQQESNLKTIKERTAFPMLAGNGIRSTDDKGVLITVPVGPSAVLFAPPNSAGEHGEWNLLEPSGSSLNFLKSDLELLRTEMRNLGKQPLATANLTVVTTANVAMKANSAVQAWALSLKDALEQAWMLTCLWQKRKDFPTVNVYTDFGIDLQTEKELASIEKARDRKDLSQRTYWEELKRRKILQDDFSADEEELRLAAEQQGLETEEDIDPATGQVIPPQVQMAAE